MKSKRRTNITPSKKVVLIEVAEIKSESGLEYVSEKKQEIGNIIAIGEGKRPVPMEVGDTIVFRKFGEDKLIAMNTTGFVLHHIHSAQRIN